MTELRHHVLCIDDDHETAGLIAEEPIDRGFKVSSAHDGEQGFQAIMTLQPDIVPADIHMPVLSGFDLLRRLTEIAPRFNRPPFLYLTAFSSRESELRGWRLGADDYITKPIDFEILIAIITARLARATRTVGWVGHVDLTP